MPKQNVSLPKVQVKVKAATPPAVSPQPAMKIPAKSLSNAKAAFKSFSLSKFAGAAAVPSNFVPTGQDVSVLQRRNQVNHLKSLDASGRSLRVALSDSDLKQYLPSFDGKTALLDELMALIQKTTRGSEFYVLGNPTLARLSVQSQVNDIIQKIKSGANDNTPK